MCYNSARKSSRYLCNVRSAVYDAISPDVFTYVRNFGIRGGWENTFDMWGNTRVREREMKLFCPTLPLPRHIAFFDHAFARTYVHRMMRLCAKKSTSNVTLPCLCGSEMSWNIFAKSIQSGECAIDIAPKWACNINLCFSLDTVIFVTVFAIEKASLCSFLAFPLIGI